MMAQLPQVLLRFFDRKNTWKRWDSFLFDELSSLSKRKDANSQPILVEQIDRIKFIKKERC